MRKPGLLPGLCLAAAAAGCTHPLRVIEKPDTHAGTAVTLSKPVKIGIAPTQDALVLSVVENLERQPAVDSVKRDVVAGSSTNAAGVDYVVELSRSQKARSSGQNFAITIPGFLVFAHAWLGYKYFVDIDTQIKVLGRDGALLTEKTVTTPYTIRFTSFPRGAATSIVGWLLPPWGLLDVIPGTMFSRSYDDRADAELADQLKSSYGDVLGREIVQMISQSSPENVGALEAPTGAELSMVDPGK